jgi:hypothetical protein
MSALPCPVADPFAAADQAYATISQFLGSEGASQVKHSDLERQLERMGRELIRKLLQAHLDLRQPGKAIEPVRDAAGTTLTPTPGHRRSLESIFGTVEVTRTGYRAEDKPSLHPLNGALNLPSERYSLEVRRRVAIEEPKEGFDEGGKTLEEFSGAHGVKGLEICAARMPMKYRAVRQPQLFGISEDLSGAEAVLHYAPCARAMISMLIGRGTRTRVQTQSRVALCRSSRADCRSARGPLIPTQSFAAL